MQVPCTWGNARYEVHLREHPPSQRMGRRLDSRTITPMCLHEVQTATIQPNQINGRSAEIFETPTYRLIKRVLLRTVILL